MLIESSLKFSLDMLYFLIEMNFSILNSIEQLRVLFHNIVDEDNPKMMTFFFERHP